MRDSDYLVTVYAVFENTGGYDPDSRAFADIISKYIYEAFDGNYLQYENYKGDFLPTESPDEVEPHICITGEGRISIKFFYLQNDDGAGREDVESYAPYCFRNQPVPDGLVLIDIICESERI